MLYVSHPLFPVSRCEEALHDARTFFDSPAEDKKKLAIERSPHFRGYSEMHNDRDWREQIHFGREEQACGSEAAYARLRGPNLWPSDPAWRQRLLTLLDDLERVGREVLPALAMGLCSANEEPYLLLKLIHTRSRPEACHGRAWRRTSTSVGSRCCCRMTREGSKRERLRGCGSTCHRSRARWW